MAMALATTTILLVAAFVSSVSGSCVGDVDETSLVQLKASVRHASERVVGDNATKDSKDTAKDSKTNSSDKNGTTNSSDDAEDMQITLNTTLKKKNKATKHALHEAAHTVDELTATLKVSGVTKDGDIAKDNMIHKLEVVMGRLDHMSSHAAQHAAEKLSEVVEHLEEEGEDVSETLKYAEHHLPEAPLGHHGGYKLNGTLANVSVKFQSPNVSNLTTMKISSLPHDATNYHKGAKWPCEYPSMCDDAKKFTAEELEEVKKTEELEEVKKREEAEAEAVGAHNAEEAAEEAHKAEEAEKAVEEADGEKSSAHSAWFANLRKRAQKGETWTGWLVGFFLDQFIVWPLGTAIRKNIWNYKDAFFQHQILALPSLIALSAWLFSNSLQDGTIAYMAWYSAILISAVLGCAAQLINYQFPYPRGGLGGWDGGFFEFSFEKARRWDDGLMK